MRVGGLVCALTCAISAAGAGAVAAREAVVRMPPIYPATCEPAEGAEIRTQTVVVAYEINRAGVTENVRVRETTDSCFNEVAVSAVRSWRYKRGASDEFETTFTFRFEEATDLEDFDASPLKRVPPVYPTRCMNAAKRSENVYVEFDVTETGETENIRVTDSTNACLDRPAMAAVSEWIYRPKLVGGEPVVRPGVRVMITFELISNGGTANDRVRPFFRRDLLRVQRRLDDAGDPQEALRDLQAIEEKYGDKFTTSETAIFYMVRGNARGRAGDYRGALDDFRTARQAGGPPGALDDIIAQLEQAVAYEDAATGEEAAGADAPPPVEFEPET